MADKNHKGKNGGHGGGKGNGNGGQAATVKSLVRSLLGSNVAAPLTGGKLKKELRAGAQLRYGPLENQLDSQLRAAKATQARNKDYFNDYLKRVRNIQQGTASIYQNANDQLAQAQQQASQGDTGILSALNAQRQGQAQTLGATPSEGANPLGQAQVARSSAALGNQARIIGQGATQSAYMKDQQRIGQRQKIDTLIAGQSKTQDVRQQLEDLAREKGAFKTDMRRDEREGERGFLVDLLSGPNARKLANIQMSGSNGGSSSSSSSSSSHEKANKGKNRNEHKRDVNDAMTELRSLDKKDKRSNVGELTRYLISQGYDASLARRVARKFLGGHKGKGGKGGKGHGGVRDQVGGTIGGVGGAAGGHH